MRVLKVSVECRVENEEEAKIMMEKFRQEANAEGYSIGKMGYTHKDKKSKGEIIDSGELLQVVKVYEGFWD